MILESDPLTFAPGLTVVVIWYSSSRIGKTSRCLFAPLLLSNVVMILKSAVIKEQPLDGDL